MLGAFPGRGKSRRSTTPPLVLGLLNSDAGRDFRKQDEGKRDGTFLRIKFGCHWSRTIFRMASDIPANGESSDWDQHAN